MLRLNLGSFSAFLIFGVLGLTTGAGFGSEAPKRLRSNIDDGRTFVLKGNTRPAVARGLARDQGEVSGSTVMPRMSLHFVMTSAQQADLERFLTAVQDRRSAQYHKFLTAEEFAARFGVNHADLAKVTIWLENRGFSNVQVARSRTWVGFSGTAGQAQTAFHTAIHKYEVNGETHFANASDPELPKALEAMALSVSGLHNFHLKPSLRSHFSGSNGSSFLAPDDWQTIYDVKPLYGAGWDGSPLSNGSTFCGGSPCSIVVVGQSEVQASDLAAFRLAAHLPAKPVTVLIPPFSLDPGFQSDNEGESDLDLEWANGIATNANVLFVATDFTVNNGVEDSVAYAIDNNVAPIMTISYGVCEAEISPAEIAAQTSFYQQANVQGMTVVAASGDSGGAGCDSLVPPNYKSDYPATLGLAVQLPASSTYVTGVGGTTLSGVGSPYWSSSNNGNGGSALGYIPEGVWNDSAYYGALAASGGGASSLFVKPSWQTGPGVPNDGQRDVPDIALAASWNQNGYLLCPHSFCVNGFLSSTSYIEVAGGTSAGTPAFAGVLALLVQKTGSPLGNINQNLYTVAQVAPNAFHDITYGSNLVDCLLGTPDCSLGSLGYNAGAGYDQATGLGSIDAFNLVEQWSADIQITASPTTLSVQQGSSTTATVTVGPLQGFSGVVSFGCTVQSGLANVSCSVPSTTVNTSGTTTVTVNAANAAGSGGWRRMMRKLLPVGLAAAGLMLLAAVFCATKKQQHFVYAWGAAGLATFLLGAISCGGGSSSGSIVTLGPPESGNIIVTATSGPIRNQVVIAVSIP